MYAIVSQCTSGRVFPGCSCLPVFVLTVPVPVGWHDSFPCVHLMRKEMSFLYFPDLHSDCLLIALRRRYLDVGLKSIKYFIFFLSFFSVLFLF